MTEVAQSSKFSELKLKTRKLHTGGCNDVLIIDHDNDTISGTFLGALLFKAISVPLTPIFIQTMIEKLGEQESRAKFCTKNGISEALANEAFKEGAGERFEKRLASYCPEYVAKKKVDTKKDNNKKRSNTDDALHEPIKPTKKAKKSTKKAAKSKDAEENGESKEAATGDDDDVDDKKTTEKDGEKNASNDE